jgi:hypothetical protein
VIADKPLSILNLLCLSAFFKIGVLMNSFEHWTDLTKMCYKRYQDGLSCSGCPNDTENLCRRRPWNVNPYGIRNVRYAMIQTLKNIGEPK